MIDLIEKLYIDKGYSLKRLAKRFDTTNAKMAKQLRAIGLEVREDNKSIPSFNKHKYTRLYNSVEDLFNDYLDDEWPE